MPDVVLEIQDLTKKIKDHVIVNRLNLSVRQSEVFGFLGPNGAGKTTTIRMLVSLIKPTAGAVSICGYNVARSTSKALEHTGCIIESPDMYPYLTGMENLMSYGTTRPGKLPESKRISEVIDLVGLSKVIHQKVHTYSLGMCQRLGIAQAIMHRPRLLILDEPTNGLDPAGIVEFRNLVRQFAKQDGMAVFVSSHLLSEIAQMCDTVGIISQGKLARVVDMQSICDQHIMIWQVDRPDAAVEVFKHVLNVTPEVSEGGIISAQVHQTDTARINAALVNASIAIFSCSLKADVLETLFLELTGGNVIV